MHTYVRTYINTQTHKYTRTTYRKEKYRKNGNEGRITKTTVDTERYNTDGTEQKSRSNSGRQELDWQSILADTYTACVLICVSYFSSEYPAILLKIVVCIIDGQALRIFT